MDITNKDQKHIVFSNGVVLPGFDVANVSNNVSDAYKMSLDKVSTRLISGKKGKVRSFNELRKAEQLIAQLTKLGLSCYLSSPGNDNIKDNAQQTEDASQSSQKEVETDKPTINSDDTFTLTDGNTKNNRRSWLKWVIPFLLLLGSLAFAAYYFSSKWVIQEPPKTVSEVESAIFTSQKPSVLIHTDLAQLRRLLSLADDDELKKKSTTILSKLPLLNSDGDYQPLLAATNYITASATFSDDSTPSNDWLMVLHGDFSNLNIRNELSKLYVLEKTEGTLLKLSHMPINSIDDTGIECPADDVSAKAESNSTSYARLNDDHILLSSTPQGLVSFETAYQDKSASTTSNLSQWQDYRDGTLFAISSLDKQFLQKDFMANAASKSLFGDSTFEFIGVRASASPITQSLELSFDADMNDNAIATELASKVTGSIDDLKAANSESFPSVIDLLSRIDVNSDQALHLTLSLNKDLINELENLASDFFGMMFSPTNISQTEPNGSPLAEELEQHAWDYTLNDKILEISEPKVDQFAKFLPVAVDGSVSIYLDAIGIKPISQFDAERGSAMQVTVDANRPANLGDAFYGWSNSGIKQSLAITEVLDNDGNNLLINERCQKQGFNGDLNHQDNDNANYSNGVIVTQKTVRLIESTTVKNIGSIKGRYQFKVPVNTFIENVSLDAPLIEWQGGSLKLIGTINGKTSYILEDDEARLLNVRGLNKDGKALKSSSSFSVGKRHTKQFIGDVVSLQLVIAGNFEQQFFEFNINNVIPKPAKSNSTSTQTKVVAEPVIFNKKDIGKFSNALNLSELNTQDIKAVSRKLNWQNFSIDASQKHELGNTATQSGVIFFKHDDQSSWGHKLSGLVILPHDESLQLSDILTSLTLTLDGKTIPPVTLSLSRTTSNGKPTASISTGSLSYDTGSFSVPFEEQRAQIKEIKGTLKYNLPTDIEVTTIDLSNPENGLTFIGYDFGWQSSVTYQLNDALSKAYIIKLSSEDGSETIGKITVNDGVSTVEFDKVERLQKIDFYFIKKAEMITEEFTFTPVYK